MGLFIGDVEPSKIFLGDTPISKVFLGDTQVRPMGTMVDFMLIGGGAAGGRANGACCHGGGGGAGAVIYREGYRLKGKTYSIVIGDGGSGGWGGCCSSFIGSSSGETFISYGGCFGSTLSSGAGGGWCDENGFTEGYSGGDSSNCRGAGGGGGSRGIGGDYEVDRTMAYGGCGGVGFTTDITGASACYAGGGGGGGKTGGGCGECGGGCGGRNASSASIRTGGSATTYGSGGGGGACGSSGGAGCKGIFVLRYPSSCGYNVTGGTKYLCNGYCIHCFTSDGTLTVN